VLDEAKLHRLLDGVFLVVVVSGLIEVGVGIVVEVGVVVVVVVVFVVAVVVVAGIRVVVFVVEFEIASDSVVAIESVSKAIISSSKRFGEAIIFEND